MNKIKRIGMVAVLTLALSLSGVGVAAGAALTLSDTAVSGDGALTLTGAATSTWSLSAGNLTIDSAAGDLILDGGGTAATSVTIVSAGGIDIDSANAITIDTTSDEVQFTTGTADVKITGTAANDALTVAAGDVVVTDGSLTLADGDVATSVSITNSVASNTADVVAVTANGLTTGSALTMSSSGAIVLGGSLVDLTADSATTAAGVVRLSADALTSGIGQVISSSSTVLTGAGRLLRVDHTGTSTAGNTSKVAEFASAATEDTTILGVTASAALAGGVALDVSAAAMTTGTAIDISNLDAINTGKAIHIDADGNTQTTGILVHVDSGSSALTGVGRLLLVDHTDTASATGTVAEIKSIAADETDVLKLTAAALTTGTVLEASGLDALTDGMGVNIESGSTALTSTGRLLLVDHTGNATNTIGVVAEIKSAAADETLITKITASDALALGAMLHFSGGSVTTGDIIIAEGLDALTTGIGIHLETGATAMTGTGRIAYFNHTGTTTSGGGGILVEAASAATDATTIAKVTASSTFSGSALEVSGLAMVDGTLLKLNATEGTLSGGKYIDCYDAAASDFSVAKYGATVIAGNASGTAALTLTKGDIVVTEGDVTVSGGNIIKSVANTLTAVGTDQATALALTKDFNVVTTGGAGAGVKLPVAVAGMDITVRNSVGNTMHIYAAASETLNGTAGATGLTLDASLGTRCVAMSTSAWICNKLGAIED